MDSVNAFGGKAIMTSSSHQRASDRVAEAAANFSADIIVMIQGDEPMTYPQMIETSLAPLRNGDKQIACVNLTARIQTEEDFVNPNTIKVVMDADGYVRITDRIKDMFIVGGFNCYPAEIENALCSMPGVARAAVIGVPDQRRTP